MAQFAEDRIKARKQQNLNSLISLFMTMTALVYMFVLGMFLPANEVGIFLMIPPFGLLVASMWFILKPAKIEL